MKVVFGQDLADESAGVAQQVFSVSVAIGGLAAFALVLALIEQVVLQVRGSSLLRHSSHSVRQFSNASSGPGFLCSCVSRMHDLQHRRPGVLDCDGPRFMERQFLTMTCMCGAAGAGRQRQARKPSV